MEWARSYGQDIGMLLIDYEKAYDRVEWGFVLMMLRALGFLDLYVQMVGVLLNDANASLEVNGNKFEFFELSISIKHGCPLAPTLFVIIAKALHYLLRDDSISPKVIGPILPNMEEISNF